MQQLAIHFFLHQAFSQTEWTTVYKIYPTAGSKLDYALNIIDTPGFGDTRGIEQDNVIVDQIRHLLSAPGEQGVSFIDAVCFIVRAPDARLTSMQKYIFTSIMSLFGKDVESNICTLVTFADGAEPPVLASLVESKLPFGSTFIFNNSALFADKTDMKHSTLAPMFWEMGFGSFQSLFKHIREIKAVSLCQTKCVLKEREQLKTVIFKILEHETAGLSILEDLKQHLELTQKNKNEIEINRNFNCEDIKFRQEIVPVAIGHHVTNCLNCNVTCHDNCTIADDDKKQECSVMNKAGNCDICKDKCAWSDHKNTRFCLKYVPETVTKTNADKKIAYEEGLEKNVLHEHQIYKMVCDIDEVYVNIISLMDEMKRCKSRLNEMALRSDFLPTVEHIDMMIRSEEMKKQPTYFNRLKMLQEFKKMALVEENMKKFSESVNSMKKSIMVVTGKSFAKEMRVEKRTQGNIFIKFFDTVISNVISFNLKIQFHILYTITYACLILFRLIVN